MRSNIPSPVTAHSLAIEYLTGFGQLRTKSPRQSEVIGTRSIATTTCPLGQCRVDARLREEVSQAACSLADSTGQGERIAWHDARRCLTAANDLLASCARNSIRWAALLGLHYYVDPRHHSIGFGDECPGRPPTRRVAYPSPVSPVEAGAKKDAKETPVAPQRRAFGAMPGCWPTARRRDRSCSSPDRGGAGLSQAARHETHGASRRPSLRRTAANFSTARKRVATRPGISPWNWRSAAPDTSMLDSALPSSVSIDLQSRHPPASCLTFSVSR